MDDALSVKDRTEKNDEIVQLGEWSFNTLPSGGGGLGIFGWQCKKGSPLPSVACMLKKMLYYIWAGKETGWKLRSDKTSPPLWR